MVFNDLKVLGFKHLNGFSAVLDFIPVIAFFPEGFGGFGDRDLGRGFGDRALLHSIMRA
jgi:hypothetical protein